MAHDEDADLAAFFNGADMTAPPVPDGGKGLTAKDAEPCPDAEEGLTAADFWAAAQYAKDLGQ